MAAHGIDSVDGYLQELRGFTMLAHAGRIACPTLLMESEQDFAGGGGESLRRAMTAPVDLVRLTAADGAGGHCAGLGQTLWGDAVYGWLRRVVG